jgi:hypothetical protein
VAAADHDTGALAAERIGDMGDERLVLPQRQRLVGAEAAGRAAGEDGAKWFRARQAVSSNSSRPIR